MKAAYFKEHGGSDKMIYGDYRDPVAGAGEVVVRVRACALNGVDMLLLDGRLKDILFRLPAGTTPEQLLGAMMRAAVGRPPGT